MRFAWVFWVLFWAVVTASAETRDPRLVTECGIYDVDAYYTEIESTFFARAKKRVLLLERGTDSQIFFYINNPDIDSLIPKSSLGVNFRVRIRFDSACYYACEGNVVSVVKPLDPFDTPRPFLFPKSEPESGSVRACKTNSLEGRFTSPKPSPPPAPQTK